MNEEREEVNIKEKEDVKKRYTSACCGPRGRLHKAVRSTVAPKSARGILSSTKGLFKLQDPLPHGFSTSTSH